MGGGASVPMSRKWSPHSARSLRSFGVSSGHSANNSKDTTSNNEPTNQLPDHIVKVNRPGDSFIIDLSQFRHPSAPEMQLTKKNVTLNGLRRFVAQVIVKEQKMKAETAKEKDEKQKHEVRSWMPREIIVFVYNEGHLAGELVQGELLNTTLDIVDFKKIHMVVSEWDEGQKAEFEVFKRTNFVEKSRKMEAVENFIENTRFQDEFRKSATELGDAIANNPTEAAADYFTTSIETLLGAEAAKAEEVGKKSIVAVIVYIMTEKAGWCPDGRQMVQNFVPNESPVTVPERYIEVCKKFLYFVPLELVRNLDAFRCYNGGNGERTITRSNIIDWSLRLGMRLRNFEFHGYLVHRILDGDWTDEMLAQSGGLSRILDSIIFGLRSRTILDVMNFQVLTKLTAQDEDSRMILALLLRRVLSMERFQMPEFGHVISMKFFMLIDSILYVKHPEHDQPAATQKYERNNRTMSMWDKDVFNLLWDYKYLDVSTAIDHGRQSGLNWECILRPGTISYGIDVFIEKVKGRRHELKPGMIKVENLDEADLPIYEFFLGSYTNADGVSVPYFSDEQLTGDFGLLLYWWFRTFVSRCANMDDLNEEGEMRKLDCILSRIPKDAFMAVSKSLSVSDGVIEFQYEKAMTILELVKVEAYRLENELAQVYDTGLVEGEHERQVNRCRWDLRFIREGRRMDGLWALSAEDIGMELFLCEEGPTRTPDNPIGNYDGGFVGRYGYGLIEMMKKMEKKKAEFGPYIQLHRLTLLNF